MIVFTRSGFGRASWRGRSLAAPRKVGRRVGASSDFSSLLESPRPAQSGEESAAVGTASPGIRPPEANRPDNKTILGLAV